MKEAIIPKMTDVVKAAEENQTDIERTTDFVKAMEITNQAELNWAVGAVAEVKQEHDTRDAKRKSWVEPLKSVAKDIDATFKPSLKALKDAEAAIKEKIAQYATDAEIRRDSCLHAAEKASGAQRDALLEQAASGVVDKVPGLSLRQSWGGEITDDKELIEWALENNRLDLISPNLPALKSITKALGSDPKIPGWLATPATTVAITTSLVES
jgi:hypothetical protein